MMSAESIFDRLPVDETQVVDNPTPVAIQTQKAMTIWGLLPTLSLVTAWGLLFVAFANTGALNLLVGAEVWFWLGLLLIIAPTATRLVAIEPSRHERIGLVVLLGLGLYLVKLLHSPFGFTYSDEFLHSFNVNQILQRGVLFTPNPIVPVSALFPGLGAITAALASLSGLSVFSAGVAVIGISRLLLVLAIFLFSERISQSARVAGITALIYMCHSNFLFWSAQFSYESLSLPLAIGVLYAIAQREQTSDAVQSFGYTLLALLGIGAIVVTHHLTSYFLAAFLLLWWLMVRFQVHIVLARLFASLGSGQEEAFATAKVDQNAANRAGPGALALIISVGSLGWLVYIALFTFQYLSFVLSRAALSVLQLVLSDGNGRQLFVSATGDIAPLWEQSSAILAILLSIAGLLFGLRQAWRHCRQHPVILLFVISAALYFAMLGLRFTTAGWETGNRASAYLFLGLAFVVALGVIEYWMPQRATLANRLLFSAGVFLLFAGGVIAGWQPTLRLAQPYLATNGEQTFEPQGVTVAKWAKTMLGAGNRMAADEANGRLMLAIGEQNPRVGRHPFVREILTQPNLDKWQLAAMREWNLRHVVVDQRKISWNNMAGYFFDQNGAELERFDAAALTKYDQQAQVDRVLDSGNIVIYDVGALANETPNQ